MLTLNDGRKELYQWDTGRIAKVEVDCDVVHFSNLKYGESLAVEVKDGEVAIPNKLLMSGAQIYCWAFANDDSGAYTKNEQTLVVIKRPKPSDYVYTETEVLTVETAVNNALEKAKESGEFKGDKGDKGDTGDRGERGIQGEKGDQGERGEQGIQGEKGDKGDKGEQGIQGLKGDKGDKGADGYTPQKGVDYFTDEDIAGLNVPSVDQIYNPDSENAQSGKAVAEALYKATNSLQAVNISFDKSNSGLESENVQDAIDEIVIKVGGMAKVESWADVQNIVNLGMAQNVFKVGEQLECGHTKYGTLVWDITDVSPEKLSLCVHKCPVSLEYDAKEALYYAETELAAGTYNFTIVYQPWYTADNGKTFQFTLTKPVPQGGQIVLDMTYNAALAGKSVKTYSGGDSTTVIETATITEGSEGTAFGKTDGSVANVNHIQRAIVGSNNYKESALRQWLNSDGAAGTFWTPQTVFDRPPSWETNTAGFINGLDADFLAVISDTTYDVGLNNVTDGGGKETLTDKFVLLSRDEIYAGSEGGVTQGEPLPYFSEFSDHNSPSTAADSNRIKTNASGTATYWWLRSPDTSTFSDVRNMSDSGLLRNSRALNRIGVAPACNIIKNQ